MSGFLRGKPPVITWGGSLLFRKSVEFSKRGNVGNPEGGKTQENFFPPKV